MSRMNSPFSFAYGQAFSAFPAGDNCPSIIHCDLLKYRLREPIQWITWAHKLNKPNFLSQLNRLTAVSALKITFSFVGRNPQLRVKWTSATPRSFDAQLRDSSQIRRWFSSLDTTVNQSTSIVEVHDGIMEAWFWENMPIEQVLLVYWRAQRLDGLLLSRAVMKTLSKTNQQPRHNNVAFTSLEKWNWDHSRNAPWLVRYLTAHMASAPRTECLMSYFPSDYLFPGHKLVRTMPTCGLISCNALSNIT